MSRILVVDDEAAITELIALNLKHAGFEAAVACDAESAQTAVNRVLPDLVVVDWMMPGLSGNALVRLWRSEQRTRDLPIIMLTARRDEADKVAVLDAGADDYLTKPFSPSELLARIRAVLRRRAPSVLDASLDVGILSVNPATRRVTSLGREVRLGATEFKLLYFMMTYPERVHSRAQLLDRVWGDHVFIEERTVDVHIKRLRASLAAIDCDAMIETVRGAGYRLADPARALPG